MQTNLFANFVIPKTQICPEKVQINASLSKILAQEASRCAIELCFDSAPPFGKWLALLDRLRSVGAVQAETGNRNAVFRFMGCYDEFLSGTKQDADQPTACERRLELFFDRWRYVFARTTRNSEGNADNSLEFLDEAGVLIHAVRPTRDSVRSNFDALAEQLGATVIREPQLFRNLPPSNPLPSIKQFDVRDFRDRWLEASTYTDQIRLTQQYGISELEGLRLMGDTWACRVPFAAVVERLGILIETGLPCALQLANSGLLQTRIGRLSRMHTEGGHLVLSGDDWCLSIVLPETASAWAVTKPVSGRLQSSIELYNRSGQTISRIHGSSEPIENRIFQDLLGTLPTVS